MKHGKGTFTWGTSGNKYTGYFLNDKRQGYGVYTWLDGNRYEGEWLNDKQHGKGKMVFPEGIKQEGTYEFGKFQGKEYISIDRKKQLFETLKNNSSTFSKKTILAVGGDHLLIKYKPQLRLRKTSKQSLSRSIRNQKVALHIIYMSLTNLNI